MYDSVIFFPSVFINVEPHSYKHEVFEKCVNNFYYYMARKLEVLINDVDSYSMLCKGNNY